MKTTTLCAALGLGVLVAASMPAQTPAAAPEFEVASIKESPPVTPAMIQAGKIHVGMKIDGAHVDIGNYTLLQLICKAYDVKSYQVKGPGWMTPMSQRFDIVANLPHGATKEQVPQMLQALLKDRFKLELHNETKDRNVYALVVAKDGIKMKESAPSPAAASEGPGVSGSNQATFTQEKGGRGATVSDGVHQQRMIPSADGKSMRLEITNTDMPLLAEGLTPLVDRPIIDMTGLKGKYDVSLDLSMQDLMAAARNAGAAVPAEGGGAASEHPADAASDPGSGSIFKSIQQLGLKLEPRKAPLTYLIVDKAEQKPTDN